MNNKDSFGFAVFGCGTISDVHARSILEIEDAHLVGAADIVYSRAEAFCEKYGGVAFENYAEILASDEVDVVCICTPSGTHADLAIEALYAGKSVVLEKPMAINVKDCDRIIEACRKTNRKLMVISQMPCDKRGLNYDKYFNQGDAERNTLTEFNSNNTKLLTVAETKEKIASLAYIQEELSKWGK